MSDSGSPSLRSRSNSSLTTITAVAAAFVILVTLGFIAFRQLVTLNHSQLQVSRSSRAIHSINRLLSLLKDVETGHRGFLLTGNRKFLTPYEEAVREVREQLNKPIRDEDISPDQRTRLLKIRELSKQKLAEINDSLTVFASGNTEEAVRLVGEGTGKTFMDQIRALSAEAEDSEEELRRERTAQANQHRLSLRILIALLALLAPVLAIAVVGASRYDARRNRMLQAEIRGRRSAEQNLQNSVNLNRSILDSSADCVKIVSTDGRILSMNRPGQLLMEIDDFSRIAGTSWVESWNESRPLAEAAMEQAKAGGVGRFQSERPTMLGTSKFWDVVVSPLTDSDGKVVELLVISRDVTELRQVDARLQESEKKMRLLADTMPQIVWSTRADGYHDYFNQRWYEFTGMPRPADDSVSEPPPAGNGKGWSLKDYVHPEDFDQAVKTWTECLKSGEPYDTEYRFRSRDGSYRWFVGKALPLRDNNGEITRWFGTCTDIEDQKQSELRNRELLASEREARSEAERATRLKDEFVATLSHELRTPLNAILGWTQILQRKGHDDATFDKAVNVIDRNCRVQVQMIEDLLDMSRIMSGKIRLEVHPLNPADIIESVVLSVQPTADVKGVEIRTILGSAGVIQADPSRLQQIIWNLLTNAIKFTPRGGRIAITLRKIGSHILMEVSDTGLGITADFLPFVFDRFRQADGSTTRKHGGLGLGLSIVKNLVEMHGGTISVTSPGPDRGSTFSMVFPLAAVRATPHTGHFTTGLSEDQDALILPSLEGLHVLIVDDEEDSRDLVKRIISEAGAEVSSFTSSSEALASLSRLEGLPDVIVSDIGMPVEDGYEFLRKVRLMPEPARNIPAAALTALARMEDRRRALLSGFQTHIAKPVDASELIAMVASLAHRSVGNTPSSDERHQT